MKIAHQYDALAVGFLSLCFALMATIGIGVTYNNYTKMTVKTVQIQACSTLPREEQAQCITPRYHVSEHVQRMRLCESMPPHSEGAVACFNSLRTEIAQANQN